MPTKSKNKENIIWENKSEFKSHFDGVRSLYMIPNGIALISVSEDCMIKAWNPIPAFNEDDEQTNEPFVTLRGFLIYFPYLIKIKINISKIFPE